MSQLWGARRWRFLLNIIDHLPRDSYYIEAILQDDERARVMGTGPGAPKIPVSEWSPETAALASIHDLLGALYAVTVAAHTSGHKAPTIQSYPRPETAAQRIVVEVQRKTHDWLREQLTPKE